MREIKGGEGIIPNEFWERFKNEKIVVNCQTEDEAKDFVERCYDNRIRWYNGNRFMTNYDDCNKNTCYCCIPTRTHESYIYNVYMRLYYCDINYYYDNGFEIIPYSEINKSIKEENKMQFSPNGYSYNGQVFRDIEEYAKYILKCKEDDRIKAEKERQDKLKAEKSKRIEELDKAYVEYFETCTEAKEKYLKTMEQYNKDYGVTASCSYNNVYSSNYFQDIIDKMLYGK